MKIVKKEMAKRDGTCSPHLFYRFEELLVRVT